MGKNNTKLSATANAVGVIKPADLLHSPLSL